MQRVFAFALLVCFVGGSVAQADLTSYWSFETNTGTTNVPDDSSNGNNGTWQNGGLPVYAGGTPTQLSGSTQSLSFDGGHNVLVPDTVLDATQGTLSVWFNTNTTGGGTRYAFGNTNPAVTGDRIYLINEGGAIQGRLDGPSSGGGFGGALVGSVPITAGTWHHGSLVWRSDGSGEFYVDGLSAGTTSGLVFEGFPTTTRIGAQGGGGSQWNGLLDDVAIFDRALTTGEVRSLSTVPELGLGYDVNDVNTLLEAYNAGGTATVDNTVWSFAQGSPAFAGLDEGDAVMLGSNRFALLLDAANQTGLLGAPPITPEPASLALFAVALTGLAVGYRRRMRSR